MGFSALLTSKLYPLLGKYIFPISAEDARQQAISRGIGATAGSVYSTPEQMARIYSEYMSPQRIRIRAQEEQVDLATNVYKYVNSLPPVKAYNFLGMVAGVLALNGKNYLKPISDRLADRFEEKEDEDE